MLKGPDYRLKILNKTTNTRCNDAGAAWKNKDNSISIVIAPGVILREDSDLVYTLFPVKKEVSND